MNSSAGQLRLSVALGCAHTLAWGSTYYLPAILAESIATDLGLETTFVFAAFSVALALSALLGPAVGRRIDLFGGRGTLTMSSLVFAAGLVLLSLAQGAATLVASWLVIGIGMAMGLYEAAFATVTTIYGYRARSAFTGITLLAGLASTICWPISAYLDVEVGWRNVCLFWAAMHVLLGLPINRFLVPADGARPDLRTERPSAAATAMGETVGRPKYAMAMLAIVFAVTWFISTGMAAHFPAILREAGASPTLAIATAAMVGPAQVLGRLVEFSLLQRFHPLLSSRMAALAHPVGALSMLAFGAPAALFFAVLHGMGNGILTIAKGTLPLALFGPQGYGQRQGLLMMPARFSQAAAPLVFAAAMERFGSSALLLTISLGIVALAALLSINPFKADQPL